MPHHIFRDQAPAHVLTTIVHCDSQAQHLWNNHRSSRPSFNRFPIIAADCFFYFFQQMMINKWTFLIERGTLCYPYFWLRRLTIILSVRLFLRVLYPLVGTPHGETGCLPPEVRPSPPPCG
jgi:hypothetical protein